MASLAAATFFCQHGRIESMLGKNISFDLHINLLRSESTMVWIQGFLRKQLNDKFKRNFAHNREIDYKMECFAFAFKIIDLNFP